MSNPSQILNVVQGVSTVVSNLLPVIEHIPDSFSKWLPPIKAAINAHKEMAAKIGLAAGAAKALRGRFGVVDAAIAAMNLRTIGASRKMTALGAIGGFALAKIIHGYKDASRHAKGLETATGAVDKKMERASRGASRGSLIGGAGLGKILAAVGGYRLLSHAISGVESALARGNSLLNDSAKTGIDPKSLLILEQAAKADGIDDITGSVEKMQKALIDAATDGAGPAARALGYLGLQARGLVKQSPVAQLQAIGGALSKIKEPELRTSLVRDIFGKSGNELLPLLTSANALDAAQRTLGTQADLLAENAAAFAVVSNRLSSAGVRLQGFFVGLTATVLPMLEAATKRLDGLDLAGQGQQFGEGVKVAVDFLAGAFADPGAFAGALIGYLKSGFLAAGNLLIAGITFAGNLLGSDSFFARLADGFQGLGKLIMGTLLKAFTTPARYLQDAIEFALEQLLAGLEKAKDDLTPGGSAEGNAARASEDAYLLAKARGTIPAGSSYQGRTFGTARSFAEVQKANAGLAPTLGAEGQTAEELIADGKSSLKGAASELFGNVAEAFRKTHIEDVLGAGEELAKAAAGIARIAARGAKIVSAFVAGPAGAAAAAKKNPFAEFATASSSASSLRTTGLSAASMAGTLLGSPSGMFDWARVADLHKTTGATPLLSAAERGMFEDARVAQGGTRATSTAGAFGAIHAGDAARRQRVAADVQRERLKEQTEIAKSNALLDEIRGYSQTTASALAGPGENDG